MTDCKILVHCIHLYINNLIQTLVLLVAEIEISSSLL
jgi:hypothetical protein